MNGRNGGPASPGGRLSVVIPAYNEERRLAASLPRLVNAMARLPDAEVLLIDDGSSDATAAVATANLAMLPNATLFKLPWNLGKGAALRLGVSMAKGDAIVFMDADLAGDVADLPKVVGALDHADVVVGSRLMSESVVTGKSLPRRLVSSAFSHQARFVTGVRVRDPQCGFKAFRADIGKLLFGLSKLDGYAFDVEILVLARQLGYRVAEVPIAWRDVDGSRVRPVRDPLGMSLDVLRARMRYSGRRRTSSFEPRIVPSIHGRTDAERLAEVAERLVV